MTKTIEERLRALEDREEIVKLKARYANYMVGLQARQSPVCAISLVSSIR
jgi:hypothetical protein